MTTDTVGGIWTYSLTLARALESSKVNIYLATMGAPLSPHQRREVGQLNNVRVFESDYQLEWMDDPWDDVQKAGNWLRSIDQRMQPGVIHLNHFSHASIGWSAPVLVVGHSCVLSWFRAVKGQDAPAQWNRYRAEVRSGLAAADAVRAPSRAMLEQLRDCYDVDFNGAVIPNACDPSMFSPGEKQPLIFSAGRLWDEAKNILLLDRIAHQLSWPVYIAGERRHPSGSEVSLNGARPLGRVSSDLVRNWYKKAAIYVLPAKYEPFGLSVLEAALSGCALVLGDIPSLRENWEGAAVFVDPCDTAALRRGIEMLIADDELRLELARRAVSRGATFTPQRLSQNYLTVYRELAATRQLIPCA